MPLRQSKIPSFSLTGDQHGYATRGNSVSATTPEKKETTKAWDKFDAYELDCSELSDFEDGDTQEEIPNSQNEYDSDDSDNEIIPDTPETAYDSVDPLKDTIDPSADDDTHGTDTAPSIILPDSDNSLQNFDPVFTPDSKKKTPESPKALRAMAQKIDNVPIKSRTAYEKALKDFGSWLLKQETDVVSQTTICAYFSELSEKYAPSSLWTKYSMLKAMLIKSNNIDISTFGDLSGFLKQKSKYHKAESPFVFSVDDMCTFIKQADRDFMQHKIVMIFGFYGFMRGGEMVKLSIDDFTILDDGDILVDRTNTKNDPGNIDVNTFIIPSGFKQDLGFDPAGIVKEYVDFRGTANPQSARFFLQIRRGIIHGQPLGKTFFQKDAPKAIAGFLGKPDLSKYRGHSFRGSGATNVAEHGGSLADIKKMGGWKSDKVAESYVKNSINSKKRLASLVSGEEPQKKRKLNFPVVSTSKYFEKKEEEDTINAQEFLKQAQLQGLIGTNTGVVNITFNMK